MVLDAFPWQYEDKGSFFAFSLLVLVWLDEVYIEMITHPSIFQLIWWLQEDPNTPQGYTWKEDTLWNKGHLVLTPTSTLKPLILNDIHSLAIVVQSGFQKTYANPRDPFEKE